MKSIDIKQNLLKKTDQLGLGGDNWKDDIIKETAFEILGENAKTIGCGIFDDGSFGGMCDGANSRSRYELERLAASGDVMAKAKLLLMQIPPHLKTMMFSNKELFNALPEDYNYQLGNIDYEIGVIIEICNEIIGVFGSNENGGLDNILRDLGCAAKQLTAGLLEALKVNKQDIGNILKAKSLSELGSFLDINKSPLNPIPAALNLLNPLKTVIGSKLEQVKSDFLFLKDNIKNPCALSARLNSMSYDDSFDLYGLGEKYKDALEKQFKDSISDCLLEAAKGKSMILDRNSMLGRLANKENLKDFLEDKGKNIISTKTEILKGQLTNKIKANLPPALSTVAALGFDKNNKFSSVMGTALEIKSMMEVYRTNTSEVRNDHVKHPKYHSNMEIKNLYIQTLIGNAVGDAFASEDAQKKTKAKLVKSIIKDSWKNRNSTE